MVSAARTLTDDERETLALYRRAAGKVHERFWPYRHHEFTAKLFRPHLPDEAALIPDAEFIALLTAFRLVYAQRERSNFGRVANVLCRAGDDEVRRIVAILRQNWNELPKRPLRFMLEDEHFDPGAMLDTWIDGEIFHQDGGELTRADLLRNLGAMAFLTIQMTVRDMCFPILGIDNVCALLLGEPMRPVPGPESDTSEHGTPAG
jgi:hypothetical protein